MTRVIVVASGKGGVGKTTITANLGVALSTYGEETLVLDADVAMANLELILGMEGKSVTLHDNIDVLLIDAPAGLEKDALASIAAAQEMILVTTPEVPSISDALKTKIIANKLGVDIIGVVINRELHDKTFLTINEIETILEVPVIAVIPDDPEVSRAAAFGEPLIVKNPKSPTSNAIMQLGADLIGEQYQPIEPDKKGVIAKLVEGLLGRR